MCVFFCLGFWLIDMIFQCGQAPVGWTWIYSGFRAVSEQLWGNFREKQVQADLSNVPPISKVKNKEYRKIKMNTNRHDIIFVFISEGSKIYVS